jgi:hypothetical protein
MQFPNHPPTEVAKIKKIELNQIFKPTPHCKQKEKTGTISVAKKTQLIKTFEYVDFLTQLHKGCFTHTCLRHKRIPPKIS